MGHWREVAASAPVGKVMPADSVPFQPACVNAAKLDHIPFADTQPDSEEGPTGNLSKSNWVYV